MQMDVIIHHNPDCGTSRNVLAIVEASGYTPTVIEYLKTGWTRPQLLGLFAAAGLTPRLSLRESKSPANDLGLLQEGVSDDVILDAMTRHPILVNRPIVCTPRGVRLCRPSEIVLELLENHPPSPFYKEDGQLLKFPLPACAFVAVALDLPAELNNFGYDIWSQEFASCSSTLFDLITLLNSATTS